MIKQTKERFDIKCKFNKLMKEECSIQIYKMMSI